MAILLVPGFMADETLWDDMVPALARFGPVVHADLRHDTSVEAMARRVLATAPPIFLLVSFSMGGYVARAIARQAPDRRCSFHRLDVASPAVIDLIAHRRPDAVFHLAALIGITSSGTVADCGKGDGSLFTNAQSPAVINFIRSQAPEAAYL